MCRLNPYQGVQRVPLILYGDHVQNAVLPVLEEDQISGLYRCRNMCDSQIVSVHVVDADRSSEHVEIVPRGER